MKSLIVLLSHVLQDCSTYCCTTTTRDLLTITRRVEHEGISFLTITLGDFATDFERSLELGAIDPTFFKGFSKNGTIPKLFSGMSGLVFNTDGSLLDKPSIAAILCIRQVCRMWKKIELPCSEERNQAAIDGYIEIERTLSMIDFELVDPGLLALFDGVSRLIWSATLSDIEKSIVNLEHIPRHGTGATATKMLPNQKYNWRKWHQRLETHFPSTEFCYYNSLVFLDEASSIEYVAPAQEEPVRVVFVPKTLKTPRVIGIEPVCMQYAQQSLLPILVERLESFWMTSRHLNFTDQSINAKLALSSSRDGKLATLDMKEASDRVHHALVWRMLAGVPTFRDACFACRSSTATLPTGLTIRLEKFASMGSALCFPIESMVFYTILLATEMQKRGLPLSLHSLRICKENVFVYGDDLIIPTDSVELATHNLEAFGLKVNSSKSFSKGNFRESCGMDAYAGEEVTTSFLRRMLPSGKRDVSGLVSAITLSNDLYKKGFFASASFIEAYIKRKFGDIPYVTETSSCVGFVRDDKLTVHRYNSELCRPEVRGNVVVVDSQSDPIDGHQAIMKWFLNGLSRSRYCYQRSVGRGRLTVKRRWSPVHSYGIAS